MKITKVTDAEPYSAPGHYEMKALRLHNKETSNCESVTLGMSHFLPGGGSEYGKAPVELIYFILEGELTVKTDNETFVLKKHESVHFDRFEGREIKNESNYPTTMLVITDFPK